MPSVSRLEALREDMLLRRYRSANLPRESCIYSVKMPHSDRLCFGGAGWTTEAALSFWPAGWGQASIPRSTLRAAPSAVERFRRGLLEPPARVLPAALSLHPAAVFPRAPWERLWPSEGQSSLKYFALAKQQFRKKRDFLPPEQRSGAPRSARPSPTSGSDPALPAAPAPTLPHPAAMTGPESPRRYPDH